MVAGMDLSLSSLHSFVHWDDEETVCYSIVPTDGSDCSESICSGSYYVDEDLTIETSSFNFWDIFVLDV